MEVLNLCLAAFASLFLQDILVEHTGEAELVTRTLNLIKVLAGRDKVKDDVAKAGGIPLVMAVINNPELHRTIRLFGTRK